MFFAILSAAVCMLCGLILFSAFYSKVRLFVPVAVYFVLRGALILIEYFLLQLYPGNETILFIDYIATILVVGFYAFVLWQAKTGRKSEKKRHTTKQSSRPQEKGFSEDFAIGIEDETSIDFDEEFNKQQISYWDDF